MKAPESPEDARNGTLHERLGALRRTTRGRAANQRHTTSGRERPPLKDIIGGRPARGAARCWIIETPFESICPTHSLRAGDFAGPRIYTPPRGERITIDLPHACLLDIETGGLAGTPVFLIGAVALDRWPPVTMQWLARDYPEERAILQRFATWVRRRHCWVTFNGKSFDAPFLHDRCVVSNVRLPAARAHLDLLHAARRHWRERLPNFRLETLEQQVLDRRRIGDVPGRDVPDLFHHYCKTGNAAPLRPVLEHNQIDLISCVELLVRMTRKSDKET